MLPPPEPVPLPAPTSPPGTIVSETSSLEASSLAWAILHHHFDTPPLSSSSFLVLAAARAARGNHGDKEHSTRVDETYRLEFLISALERSVTTRWVN